MSLILVATVCGVLLERRIGCSPERRVGLRRGGAMDTAGDGERAAHRRVRPAIVPDAGRTPAPRDQPSGAASGSPVRTKPPQPSYAPSWRSRMPTTSRV